MTAPRALLAGGLALGLLLGACTATPPAAAPPTTEETITATEAPSPASPAPAASSPRPSATASTPIPTRTPVPEFDVRDALDDIEALADDIGPREATSKSFDEAADLVEQRLEKLGYDVSTEKVRVPAGNSWGTPVRAGSSRNVIADPVGFDDEEPHVVVVAHLDTVPVAPGAEDNASGVAVLLELARLVATAPPDLPVRFIAFGAEEPRGAGDALHHFGSQQHVDDLSRAERRAIMGVVALDRVGVRASYVPVCSARASGNDLRADVRAAARKVEVATRACGGNTTSDHWSYVKAGVPGIRLGSVPYAGYHSPGDTPDVIDRRQLDRVGSVMWAWLQSL
ncbi:MAG TPA: M28 family metallopeptidase [Microlunatus sp.]